MEPSRLLDDAAMAQTLERMGAEIIEKCRGGEAPVLVGIQRRGVFLADRLAAIVSRTLGPLRRGKLDITLYRDDLQQIGPRPVVGETRPLTSPRALGRSSAYSPRHG